MTISKLAELAKNNPKIRAVLEHLAARDRNPKDGIEDIRRTKTAVRDNFGVDLSLHEYDDIYEYFEQDGVGKRTYNSAGAFLRFKWTRKPKEFAAQILAGSDEKPKFQTKETRQFLGNPADDLVYKLMAEINKALPGLNPSDISLLKKFIEHKVEAAD